MLEFYEVSLNKTRNYYQEKLCKLYKCIEIKQFTLEQTIVQGKKIKKEIKDFFLKQMKDCLKQHSKSFG